MQWDNYMMIFSRGVRHHQARMKHQVLNICRRKTVPGLDEGSVALYTQTITLLPTQSIDERFNGLDLCPIFMSYRYTHPSSPRQYPKNWPEPCAEIRKRHHAYDLDHLSVLESCNQFKPSKPSFGGGGGGGFPRVFFNGGFPRFHSPFSVFFFFLC